MKLIYSFKSRFVFFEPRRQSQQLLWIVCWVCELDWRFSSCSVVAQSHVDHFADSASGVWKAQRMQRRLDRRLLDEPWHLVAKRSSASIAEHRDCNTRQKINRQLLNLIFIINIKEMTRQARSQVIRFCYVFAHPTLLASASCFRAGRPPCSFVRSSGHIGLLLHDVSLSTLWTILRKLTANIHFPLLMTRLDSGGQMSKVRVTAGCQGGEDIHVDTRASKSSSCLTGVYFPDFVQEGTFPPWGNLGDDLNGILHTGCPFLWMMRQCQSIEA